MKRIIILLTPILMFVAFAGCSKDHDAPTNKVYSQLESPGNVEATYDPLAQVVDVNWDMDNTDGVIGFYLAVSDSSSFDDGNVRSLSSDVDVSSASYAAQYDVKTYVSADVDSLILYFTVSALYDNETFNNFIGPRANIDSALVLRK